MSLSFMFFHPNSNSSKSLKFYHSSWISPEKLFIEISICFKYCDAANLGNGPCKKFSLNVTYTRYSKVSIAAGNDPVKFSDHRSIETIFGIVARKSNVPVTLQYCI